MWLVELPTLLPANSRLSLGTTVWSVTSPPHDALLSAPSYLEAAASVAVFDQWKLSRGVGEGG